MQLVCARFGHDGDCRGIAALGGQTRRFDFEFLCRIGKRHRHGCANQEVHVIGAIQAVVGSSRNTAADGDLRAAEQPPRNCSCLYSSAVECDQVGHLAPCLDQRRVDLNLDLLGHLTHFQHRVDHRSAVHLQHNSRLYKCAKSRQSRFQFITAQRQV